MQVSGTLVAINDLSNDLVNFITSCSRVVCLQGWRIANSKKKEYTRLIIWSLIYIILYGLHETLMYVLIKILQLLSAVMNIGLGNHNAV